MCACAFVREKDCLLFSRSLSRTPKHLFPRSLRHRHTASLSPFSSAVMVGVRRRRRVRFLRFLFRSLVI
ncbi:60S ribosomal protein L13a, putative [Leishmania donovani]|uniref:60S ribosomal protein L13a, putative n=1 Tax=Leishmania donovani TaxID=5661 RepID=E9BC63_LEIDO|nr:60S ribosomal protein L13a, putative [Leishmania donovani]CBZ32839.1 60S ribosomal protein L13a, putative [Leishmania donovani]